LDTSFAQSDDLSEVGSVISAAENVQDTRSRSVSGGDIGFFSSYGVGGDAGNVSSFGETSTRYSQIDYMAASIGASLAETFFHFFALTDQLTLHSLKQAIIEGQPASRLALLLYTVVFRHPVFDGFNSLGRHGPDQAMAVAVRDDESLRPHNSSIDSGVMPRILVPFAKQLLYYLGFFPEVSVSMEPLVEVSEWLRASVLAYERQKRDAP
jgi:hypothetical protein